MVGGGDGGDGGGGGGGGGRGVAGGGGGGGGRAGATAGCGPERAWWETERRGSRCSLCLRLQQQCSVQCAVCSTAGAGTETGGRHGCDAVAMHASRYADVMQQKRRRAVVVLPGLGDGLSAAAGCRCWLLAATAIS